MCLLDVCLIYCVPMCLLFGCFESAFEMYVEYIMFLLTFICYVFNAFFRCVFKARFYVTFRCVFNLFCFMRLLDVFLIYCALWCSSCIVMCVYVDFNVISRV